MLIKLAVSSCAQPGTGSERVTMEVLYKSTRSDDERITASMAVLKGMSQDGGLYVPTRIPRLEVPLTELARAGYREVAYQVLRIFLTDFTEEELRSCIDKAYDSKFDTEEPVVLRRGDRADFLELYHGPTIAFKDMALTLLPHLLTTAAARNGEDREIVILTATSGDTGKAAMAGFADVPRTRIMVFYPKNGVSALQEKQMVTQRGENTRVIGIYGNFDDAQTAVKEIFLDKKMQQALADKGYRFSSANSINIGRLVPQIVYYVYAYTRLLASGEIREGDKVNFAVPTGNFGNILAASYAKKIGLPIGMLICASNSNKVLYDFFSTGTYDRRREFLLTTSPSMDILVSSNLERLLYHASGDDTERTSRWMEALQKDGEYSVPDDVMDAMSDFAAGYATDEETAQEISRVFKETGCVLDPHTAVGSYVYRKYVAQTGDHTRTVVVSTASPYKFESAVLDALGEDTAALQKQDRGPERISELSGVPVPAAVSELRHLPVRHTITCEGTQKAMEKEVRRFLGLSLED